MQSSFLHRIENVKPENKTAVDAVQKQYDALTDEQKALIPKEKREKLEELKTAFAGPSEEDQQIAEHFTETVNALPGNKAGEGKSLLDSMTEMLNNMCARFCEAYGYGLDISSMNFDGMLAAVKTGKYDFALSGIAITDERKQSVNFSDPYYTGGYKMAVLKAGDAASGSGIGAAVSGFFREIGESFEKTFIREDRWKLLLEGSITTLIITALSILFGTILGFAVYLACRGGKAVINTVTRFCVWLVQGMPVIVFLMILYYIIFGKVSISGTWVSVIGFSLIFGAGVISMLKTGVGAVGPGQAQAAAALGYSNRKAFFRVVLPQAVPHVMPTYLGQVTSLLKGTSVVGYIAVQDLTKMGDIIRSRTYEAFFPLISVAVIYFVLAGILGLLVQRLGRLLDVRKRRNGMLLKGVKIHD